MSEGGASSVCRAWSATVRVARRLWPVILGVAPKIVEMGTRPPWSVSGICPRLPTQSGTTPDWPGATRATPVPPIRIEPRAPRAVCVLPVLRGRRRQCITRRSRRDDGAIFCRREFCSLVRFVFATQFQYSTNNDRRCFASFHLPVCRSVCSH